MSRVEVLTHQFYAWERRCRGWDVSTYAVELEPTFKPFFYHSVPADYSVKDDGKRSTVLSSLFSLFKSKEDQELVKNDDAPLDPYPFKKDTHLVALSISLSEGRKIKVEETEQLLLMLSQSEYHISFEILGTHDSIMIQFVCREPDAITVQNTIKAYYPDVVISFVDPENIILDGVEGVMMDLGLKEEFMRPLNMVRNYDLDPYISLFSVLENLKEGEQAVIQILFQGAINPWAESIIHSVLDNKGNSFFLDAPEMVKMAQEKISAPLFGIVIRIFGQSTREDYGFLDSLSNNLINVTKSSGNQLILLNQKGYNQADFEYDIYYRQSHRIGMILNTKELATMIHFPSASVSSRKFERDIKRTKAAPLIYKDHEHIYGGNNHHGEELEVTVSKEQRLKHTHVIGATGTGKSTLLFTSIIQDITNGEGVAVLDPHGDLIDNVLAWIHPDRHKDVILIDPSDSEFPVGFNILTAHSEIEKDILSSDLVSAFKRLSTSWGDQMNSVFANAILAFLESDIGGTLVDLRKFLIEKSFREQFLKTVKDPSIVYYWQKEFPILKSSSIGPILTRLDSFLRPKLIRNMVAQNKSLDFEDILDSKKILLMKLSQGLMGAENSYLLGTFMVSKIQQAAMARQSKQQADRSDFYLYIDEFQNFITPSMSAILSGARKYHLGLILAHQDMQQLHRNDSDIESCLLANVGTRICFRLGDSDAKKFASGFSFFDEMDLQNLHTGEAIIRIERPENDCNMQTMTLHDLDPEVAQLNKSMVITASRNKYGTPKAEIEALLIQGQEILEEAEEEYKLVKLSKQKANEEVRIDEPVKLIEKPEELKSKPPQKSQEDRKQETQHRYLQLLIKKMAESRGYKTIIEQPTGDGKGRVDVSLERNGKRIAVEINDTSKEEWELQNIKKCLNDGYSIVIECPTNTKTIDRLKYKIEKTFSEDHKKKIHVLDQQELYAFLDTEIAKEASTEVLSKGYRVKRKFSVVQEVDANRIKETITKSVVNSMKTKNH